MSVRRIAFLSVFTVLALGLAYLESRLPFFHSIPGMKIGLPNLVIFYVLYKLSWKEAGAVSLLRIFLAFFLFGNPVSLWYSLAGGILSLALMAVLKAKTNLAKTTVSILGAVTHNIAQVLVAAALLSAAQILYYLPVLMLFGVASGFVIGLLASILIRRVPLSF